MSKSLVLTSVFLILGRCHPKGWHFSVLQMYEFVTHLSPCIHGDAGAILYPKPGTTSYIYFFGISHIKDKHKTGGYYYGLQDYAEDIGLPRSTGGAQTDLSRKSLLHRKNGGFSGAIIVPMGKHDRPAIGEKGCARQITNGVGSDDTAVIPGDIIHFFKEDDKYGS